jgi:regulatory protein
MPVVTLLERQKNNPQRVNVYLDGEFAFGLNELDAAALRKGQTLSSAEIALLSERDAVTKAVDVGVNLLSYRPRSAHEVRTALAKKGLTPPVIDAALERLQALGYLDDHAFARFWVESRATFKPLASRALRYELKRKGVADDVLNDVLASQTDEAAAQHAAQTQANKLRGLTPQAFKVRLLAFLQRRGFSYSVSLQAIKHLEQTLIDAESDYFAQEDL